ncbi:hypothetical protein PG985_008268 [Apiospora marii]|uniref:uncharacterized protein n=1 Tax=Apiospora marii TaxID=335849 RepID=UPI00312D276F
MASEKYLDLTQIRPQPDLEPSAFHPYQGIEVQSSSALVYTQRQEQDSGEKDAAKSVTDTHRRRILGLTVPVFWGLLIALVLVVAGAIGGGLAAQGRTGNNNSTTEPSRPGNLSSSGTAGEATATPKSLTPQPTDESASVTILMPMVQVSAVPLSGGCPKINGTWYTPPETSNGTSTATASAAAAGITLQGQMSPQAFVQLCNTNFPEGSAGVRDLVSFFTPTFEQCMNSCAQYNSQYQQILLGSKRGQRVSTNDGKSGFCTAVSIWKRAGGKCYLKGKDANPFVNDTLQSLGWSPTDFITGLLIDGIQSDGFFNMEYGMIITVWD